MPDPLVVDASAALAFIRREPRRAEVAALLEQQLAAGGTVIVPEIFWLEVTNVSSGATHCRSSRAGCAPRPRRVRIERWRRRGHAPGLDLVVAPPDRQRRGPPRARRRRNSLISRWTRALGRRPAALGLGRPQAPGPAIAVRATAASRRTRSRAYLELRRQAGAKLLRGPQHGGRPQVSDRTASADHRWTRSGPPTPAASGRR
jgi:hypothetical protein